MTPVSYAQFLQLALPEVCVVIAAIVVLAVDLLLRSKPLPLRFGVAAALASIGCFAAIARLLTASSPIDAMQGMFVANVLTSHVQVALLLLTIVTLLLSIRADFTNHVGEYVLLILLATTGMMFLVSSRDILVTFLSLELLSLALYALTAFDKRRQESAEAGLKYFLFGGMSAAFLLFGFSFVYGLAHATGYEAASHAIASTPLAPLVALTLMTTVIGFGFKVAAAPFHFWAPDVYQGAPNPTAGFIASSSKVASFFALYVLMVACFSSAAGSAAWMHLAAGWTPILAIVATLSMLVGNLGALVQSSLRRLLAYSAIAHAGYMLIAVVAHTPESLGALLYYVFTYSLSTLGSFAVVAVVEQNMGNDQFESFKGLSRRAPVLSACLFVFLLSQAGIPPLSGFFGKFYLFVTALGANEGYSALLWLVILAFCLSAVSLYYYLKVLKLVYVADVSDGDGRIQVPILTTIVIFLLALGVIIAGCIPEHLLQWFHVASGTL
jgi:NADH-quinone oxidoreductase subunit N